MDKLIFTCVNLDDKKTIKEIGVYDKKGILGDAAGSHNLKIRLKQDLIDEILLLKNNCVEFEMETNDGTKVILIKKMYFRTDGDENEENDLLDLDNCKLKFKITKP